MSAPKTSEQFEILGLLGAIDRDGNASQRSIARELDVALGLVNAYMKRCAKKGYVKVRQVPAHRYVYYLTPKGLAEKTRLTAAYLSYSLSYFRNARLSCAEALDAATAERGWRTVALVGAGELAEIAMLCAYERGISVKAVIDPAWPGATFVGTALVPDTATVADNVDGFLITAMKDPQTAYEAVLKAYGPTFVAVPAILGVTIA